VRVGSAPFDEARNHCLVKVGLGRGLTCPRGFLIGAFSDRIINQAWQEAAEGW
jgi:hypothetical protein